MSSRTLRLALLFFVCAGLVVRADDPRTKAVQQQLDAAKKSQVAAQKQIALKQAEIDVAKKRIAELQKQIEQSQKSIAADAAALKKAQQTEVASGESVVVLQKQLAAHNHANGLIAAADAVRAQADAAQKKHDTLVNQLADTKRSLFEAKQKQAKAEAELKKAQEQLPKSQEALTKARTTLDAAAKELDVARVAVSTARSTARADRDAIAPAAARVARAKLAHDKVLASTKSLEEALAAVRAAAVAGGTDPNAAGAEIAQSLASLKPLEANAAAIMATASQQQNAATAKATASAKGLADKQSKIRELQTKYSDQSKAHFKLQLQVADLQGADKLNQTIIAEAKKSQETLAAAQTQVETQIAAAASEVEAHNSEYVAKMKLAEAALEPLGRFVSFSNHIAPIFAKRCVACHNTRTASGRLNMDSFAAILKGGESGASLEAHNAEDSLLVLMIEDGSMPQKADPLSKDEISVIRKWIDAGAPLDAGLVASAELFQVIPEVPQPLPPKSYRVPIPVTATAFNPEGNILATSGYHEILLWSTDDNKLIRRITNVAERVYDLEFSADGSQLAVAAGTPGQLGEVKLFSVADGRHMKTLVRTKDAVFAVTWSPDGKSIASGGADRVVSTVEVATGKTQLTIEDHADWVMDVNWSPDGSQLVTASRDKTAKVFNVADGRSLITFNGHGNSVYTAAFLKDGKQIVSGGSDKQLRVWNVADGKEARKIGGFGSDIFRIAVTAENHVLSACADTKAYHHNAADGKAVRSFAGHKDWVYTLAYSAKRKLLASGSYDGEIRLWNSEDGSVAGSFIAVPQADTKAVAAAEE